KMGWEAEQRDVLQPQLKKSFLGLLAGLKKRLQERQAKSKSEAVERILGLPLFNLDPKEKPDPKTSAELRVVATDIKFVANPVLALRDQAVTEPALFGMVLAGHHFDEKGALRIVGLVRNDKQREEQIQKPAEKALEGKAKVDVAGMVILGGKELPSRLQPTLAAAEKDR